MEMLSGEQLGAALTQAMELKKVGPTEVARHFGIQPPSVKDWQKKGCIHKKHLGKLVSYFSDVVTPSHWGVQQLEAEALASAWTPHLSEVDPQASAISTGDGRFRPVVARETYVARRNPSMSEKPSLRFGIPAGTSAISAPVVAWADLEVALMKPNREWPEEAFCTSVAIAPMVSDHVKFATVADSRLPNISPGDIVAIDPMATPHEGSVVLVKLPSGRPGLYRYRPLATGAWEAFAPNEPPLDSTRHGLTLMGCVVSIIKGTI